MDALQSLNAQQYAVATSNHPKILCLAAAGAGKTHTMVSRLHRLVNDGVDPKSILVLTFTNAAAFEMQHRYIKDITTNDTPTFGTFHAFCYSLIIANSEIRMLLGYADIPRLANPAELKSLAVTVAQQCNIKLSQNKLHGRAMLSPKEQREYEMYWKKYNKLMRSQGLITFDIMCYEICELFRANIPLVAEYKHRYKHVFVDEFQDTDRYQWEFVESFSDSNLYVVGDVFQAIYQFRGGDSTLIKEMSVDPDWEVHKLPINYRSTVEICNYANRINAGADASFYLEMISDRSGCEVEEIASQNHSIENIVDQICTSSHTGSKAIIARTNAEVESVKYVLDKRMVPYTVKKQDDYISMLLRSAVDEEYAISWVSAYLNMEKFTEYTKLCAIFEEHRSMDNFAKLYGDCWEVKDVLDDYNQVVSILGEGIFPFQKCCAIIDYLHLDIPYSKIATSAYENAEIVAYLTELYAANSDTVSDLYVGTIHSVKGLEFDVVYVLGVNSDSFKVTSEAMRNLFYVACTRAKHKLVVY